jgi:hypothetical protein
MRKLEHSGKKEPNIKSEKIISNAWKILQNCFRTNTKLRVAVLSFSGPSYLYKQEFSAMNVIKSDLSITLLLKQC